MKVREQVVCAWAKFFFCFHKIYMDSKTTVSKNNDKVT